MPLCVGFWSRSGEEKEISFETDLDQNTSWQREELLDIVWNNLISNALKFTPQGGTVSITAKREDNRAVVTVNDTGCGMVLRKKGTFLINFIRLTRLVRLKAMD